jgi:hypothetical protein
MSLEEVEKEGLAPELLTSFQGTRVRSLLDDDLNVLYSPKYKLVVKMTIAYITCCFVLAIYISAMAGIFILSNIFA